MKDNLAARRRDRLCVRTNVPALFKNIRHLSRILQDTSKAGFLYIAISQSNARLARLDPPPTLSRIAAQCLSSLPSGDALDKADIKTWRIMYVPRM